MKKEFTGFRDKNGKKLYLGDKVIADTNGAIGKIGKHFDDYTYDKPFEAYHVSWGGIHENLGGVTNEHIIKKITRKVMETEKRGKR